MLRECHRVVKPGGHIAGYVIHTPGRLSATNERRASELGPDDVVGAALPEDLTRQARFSRQWEAELRAEQGNEEYIAGCERGRRC